LEENVVAFVSTSSRMQDFGELDWLALAQASSLAGFDWIIILILYM